MLTAPLALLGLVMALLVVPSHVNETTDPVDNLGGVLSIVLVASVVLAINFAPVPRAGTVAAGLLLLAILAGAAFVVRQRKASSPLFDLHIAARRTFWVAACAGIVVFGTLMAAIFVGQQFMQNVLGCSALGSGAAMIPAALALLVAAPISARLIVSRGSQVTLLAGYAFCALGPLAALVLLNEGSPPWQIALSFILLGIEVGLAGTPSSHSLTGSVPVSRVGMASGNRRPAKRSRRGNHAVRARRDSGRRIRRLLRRQC